MPKSPTLRFLRRPAAWHDPGPGLRLLALAACCGALSGATMVAFRLLIDSGQALLLGRARLDDFAALSPLARFALACAGGAALGLLFARLPATARLLGVAHVLERCALHGARLPGANALVQFAGAAGCLICGHSVGREGPAIHIGAAAGSLLAERSALPLDARRLLVACGTAGGIAAAFNTPLAGVAFAVEVLLGLAALPNLTPVLLAAVVATAVSRAAYGDHALLAVQPPAVDGLGQLPALTTLGLASGLLAIAFVRALGAVARWRPALGPAVRLTLGGCACGVLGALCPEVMGLGYGTARAAIDGTTGAAVLGLILAAKFAATVLGLGLGLPGGLIGPSLVLGALAGGVLGHVLPGADPGLYALLGMGAMMGATLNAPLAALVALLELTQEPRLILPAMLAIAAADLVCHRVFGLPSVFVGMLHARGVDYPPRGAV